MPEIGLYGIENNNILVFLMSRYFGWTAFLPYSLTLLDNLFRTDQNKLNIPFLWSLYV